MVHLRADAAPAVADRREGATTAGPAVALGSYEENSDPRLSDPRIGCPRWPEGLWLLSSLGQLVQGRCQSTNLCDYCAVQAAWENTTLLAHDALQGDAPQVLVVLGSRSTALDGRTFYRAREQVRRALRHHWPEARMARLTEYTTGYGPRSGGLRRPHDNLLVKGVRPDEATDLGEVAFPVWCRHVDAEPEAQYAAAIRDVGGLMPYLAHHFSKTSQKPPAGFRGHRFRAGAGYLWAPTPEARRIAREALQTKRDLWRATELLELGAHDAELYARERAELRRATTWRLYYQRLGAAAGAAQAPASLRAPEGTEA